MKDQTQNLPAKQTRKLILPYWKEFCDLTRANQTPIEPNVLSKLNRFRARHRLATKLVNLHAEGFSEQSLRGYTAGLRLMLAYSAAEMLGGALGKPVTEWEIKEPQLALLLRSVLNRAGARKDAIFSKDQLKSRLDDFLKGSTDDVRIAATALRVMVAHGSFTPSGTDSLTVKGSQAISQLTDLMLKTAEKHFANYVTTEISKRIR